MDDLISRQAVSSWLKQYGQDVLHGKYKFSLMYIWKNLMDLPPAEPEHKKGRWIPDNRPDGGFWVCSECKFPSEAFAADVLYKFCPNCGAKMKGEMI